MKHLLILIFCCLSACASKPETQKIEMNLSVTPIVLPESVTKPISEIPLIPQGAFVNGLNQNEQKWVSQMFSIYVDLAERIKAVTFMVEDYNKSASSK